MYSPVKILVCVALVSAATASRYDWRGGSEVRDSRPLQPYQWQTSNNWNLRTRSNAVNSYNQNLNGEQEQSGQPDNSPQSDGENSSEQSSGADNINRNFLQGGNYERQYSNERNGLQSLNGYPSGLGDYSFSSSSANGQRSSGRRNWQRQPNFSRGFGNNQDENSALSVEQNEGQLARSNSLNNNQDERSGISSASTNSWNQQWGGEREGSSDSRRVNGNNQNLSEQPGSLGENNQQNPSELNQSNNRVNSDSLESQRWSLSPRWRQTSRGNNLWGRNNGDSQNDGEQRQELGNNRQNNGDSISDNNRVSSQQAQSEENLGRFGVNQGRGYQGELRGDDNGRKGRGRWNQQRLQSQWNGSGRNISSRQEEAGASNSEELTNSETTSNSDQSQQGGTQINAAQQQPNTYTYGQLSAKILKVIQSNPSMFSNMEGLSQQLQNGKESGNQQIRQLKPLLQEIGKFFENPSPGARSGEQQQNSLTRNLLEVVNRNVNTRNEWNIPTSYQSFSSWGY